ncbi:hypothetical protein GIB67_032951 [Kingdonia uniflora]|uniref:endo-polygalacturonase n=1 Tax=Kingdonia uniflora TaxID=39325 RepID=A0A7J7MYE4_9MAGN|nr:hypothetical protein GIB67_032951 [Kingdonia uniflora]
MMRGFILILLLAVLVPLFAQDRNVFDVVDYGAIGDGKTNDTQAFENAWKAACNPESSSDSTLIVPVQKTFLLRPITFEGPCSTKHIYFQINGTIVAPSDIDQWGCDNNHCDQWIKFTNINGLYLYGNGVIDGQGSNWWATCNYNKNHCPARPTAVKIADSNYVHVRDIRVINSPEMHVVILKSSYVHITNINIFAPEDSPNTDGIHIDRSSNVNIDHSHIGTGDDCISIGTGTSQLTVYKVRCGPGHGISIGSLGKHGAEDTVEDIHVNHVDFWGTSNGVRIKTWQGGKGYARNITFENIKCHSARYPIIINQYYCDHTACKNQTSAVQISNVSYRRVRGTSVRDTAVSFACSETVPCTGIVLEDVKLRSTRHDRETLAYCLNAYGKGYGQVVPTVPCLG